MHPVSLGRGDILPFTPTEPVPFVVRPHGVGVVVTELSSHPFIATEEHGGAATDEHGGKKFRI